MVVGCKRSVSSGFFRASWPSGANGLQSSIRLCVAFFSWDAQYLQYTEAIDRRERKLRGISVR